MYAKIAIDPTRINARETDVFDIFNVRHYIGPNPYLETEALVFDFALTGDPSPISVQEFLRELARELPQLKDEIFDSHAHLFARTVSEVGKLNIGLHLNRWSLKTYPEFVRVAVQCLHKSTQWEVLYCVWDWFEAIGARQSFNFQEQLKGLQEMFSRSVFGGPSTYALIRAAQQRGIPTTYLWNEGLVQYGYGKKQIRGASTTFSTDSHLDSDFTCRKDDCKAFLGEMGFPVPQGGVVATFEEAAQLAGEVGYPVVVKPLAGHKGIGVTANILTENELEFAFRKAVESIETEGGPVDVIVEKNITGSDFRLLCIHGKFTAAVKRQPASVVGDGNSSLKMLIDRENQSPARQDTPTSPLGKIKSDDSMMMFLQEQGLTLESIIEPGRRVFLRKVANLSAGGVSYNVTDTVHPDNVTLAEDIAQYLHLTCLGIDVIAGDLATSWKEGGFGIIEINAAPGIFMHLNPAVGSSIDVPSKIVESFFPIPESATIPIITLNRATRNSIQNLTAALLNQNPKLTVGAVCQSAVMINQREKFKHPDYNHNVSNLLRNPKLDVLIAEYRDETLEAEGVVYQFSTVVILENPTEAERTLARDVCANGLLIVLQGRNVTVRRQGITQGYEIDPAGFEALWTKEILHQFVVRSQESGVR